MKLPRWAKKSFVFVGKALLNAGKDKIVEAVKEKPARSAGRKTSK
jgi:hypothetical protein